MSDIIDSDDDADSFKKSDHLESFPRVLKTFDFIKCVLSELHFAISYLFRSRLYTGKIAPKNSFCYSFRTRFTDVEIVL